MEVRKETYILSRIRVYNAKGLTGANDPFVDVLLNGPYQREADMNDDQVVNGLDVDPFVTAVVGDEAHQIPEPSTLLLGIVALGLVGVFIYSR